jgi:hypothetical protein
MGRIRKSLAFAVPGVRPLSSAESAALEQAAIGRQQAEYLAELAGHALAPGDKVCRECIRKGCAKPLGIQYVMARYPVECKCRKHH